MKLDLGCGTNKKQDFVGVDAIAFPGVDVVADLREKWPWEDGVIDEAYSSHFIEHLDPWERVHFWNELYRVLKPGAKSLIIAPHWSSCRAYGDPSHKWPPVCEFALFYLKKDWRTINAPHSDSANIPNGFNCNFEATWGYSLNQDVALRNQEYQQFAMTFYKEAAQDIVITVTKV